jgi:ABC-type polysaccharide transport system, permease component
MLEFIKKQWTKNKYVYIMLIPVLLYYIIFCYLPMYGVTIAFKNFIPRKGILGSPFVGLVHFKEFFNSYYFWRLLRNTLGINIYSLLFGFPAPIIFALLLNEVKNNSYKRITQTVTYLPHFISMVVIAGMILQFTSRNGLINDIISMFGFERIPFMIQQKWFWTVYVVSGIWQNVGWDTIIYLAALSGISIDLYEASKIDGASRFKQAIHITLPGISPTIIIILILNLGNLMNVGFEKIILLYNSSIYETSDVISSFVYRKGIVEASYSYSAAVGLFNSAVNFALLLLSNKISGRLSETSLW